MFQGYSRPGSFRDSTTTICPKCMLHTMDELPRYAHDYLTSLPCPLSKCIVLALARGQKSRVGKLLDEKCGAGAAERISKTPLACWTYEYYPPIFFARLCFPTMECLFTHPLTRAEEYFFSSPTDIMHSARVSHILSPIECRDEYRAKRP
jgi:hypothetical protein